MENNVSNEGTGKDPNNGFLHHKDRINPKQFGQNNESIFNFMDHTETINQLPCVEDANAIASNIPPVRQAPIRSSDQLQPAMELSLEGLKSLDQHPVREGRHSDAGDGVNGLPSGLIPGADLIAQGETSTSTTSVDEKAAPHGVQGGVADIAPVRLQVSETNKAPNSAIEVLVSQGRRPFEVVLKGGTPWGFALNGGPGTDLPLYISKIVTDGKASDSALLEGDYVLQINSVPCAEVGEALDIVDTATQTLALLVLSSSCCCIVVVFVVGDDDENDDDDDDDDDDDVLQMFA
ncbi:PDZ and LIM domain protein 7 [Plakobranchus ocellatus]|uniref:PDZ and LIM domain protein 7 n=1 Tax=Plakobranchus ocellatus TaxID=259542 RepID=A0AAV3Y0N3_9GAST|nr:PDZ and LIM domain protein 7 [Plakobranchus ocellatus]